MPVKHLAVDAVTASPDATVRELSRTMRDEQVGDVIISEGGAADGRPVGIVTDRDVALAAADGIDLDAARADEVMSEDPVTIHGDAEAVELPARMADARVRRMPVVEDDGTLLGVATLDDVVATTGEELADIATVIESQSPGYSP